MYICWELLETVIFFFCLHENEQANIVLGELHLHPVSETHQFRPTLTYLDFLSQKNRRRGGMGSDSDSDDGPPPDPDDPTPVAPTKKEKKASGEAKEVQVSARKADDKGGMQPFQGGLSTVRREMLQAIRAEEDESWEDLHYNDVAVCCSPLLYSYTVLNLCLLEDPGCRGRI